MKTLKEAYVIVKQWESQYKFFQDFISFNKSEIEFKCSQLNEEGNAVYKKNYEKKALRNKKKEILYPHIPTIIYIVMKLSEAIDKFGDDVAEANTEHSEDY